MLLHKFEETSIFIFDGTHPCLVERLNHHPRLIHIHRADLCSVLECLGLLQRMPHMAQTLL